MMFINIMFIIIILEIPDDMEKAAREARESKRT